MKLSRLALAIALASPAAFAANETPRFDEQLKLPEVVVTASRTAESKGDTYSAVTVFTRDDIERLQPSTVPDLLRRTPGVQVMQNGGRGSTVGVFVRGTKTAQTLVLIDGQRANDTNLGGAPLNTLSIDQIERIEILRGPRSAIYGSDALGGVIQIFTRRSEGEGLKPRVRTAYGSHDTWEQSLGLSGGNATTRFNLSLNHEQSNGFSRSSQNLGTDSDDDGFRNSSAVLNLNHRIGTETEAGLSVRHTDSESDNDFSGAGTYPYDEVKSTYYAAYLNTRITTFWSTRLDAGYSESEMFNLGTSWESYSKTRRESLNWANALVLSDAQRLQVGLDWYRDHVDNSTEYAVDSRYNAAAFLQHSYKGERFGTELGLRHDDNEQFGTETTWNAALKLPLHENHQLVFSYAEGFRAPLFSELYYPGFDNPNLKPETSKTYEVRWLGTLAESIDLEAALYRTDLEDAIVNDAFWVPHNVQKARLQGFEMSVGTEVLGWQNQLSLSLLNAEDQSTGNDLVNRARKTLSWDVDRQFDQVAVGATWTVSGQAYSDPANATAIPGFGLLGLRASWQAHPELEVAVKVDNLLDKSYYTTTTGSGVPYQEDGRSAQLAFTWTPSL